MQKLEMPGNLASVIGEDELSPIDKKYLEFGKEFETRYIGQGVNENRTIEETLDLGWGTAWQITKRRVRPCRY